MYIYIYTYVYIYICIYIYNVYHINIYVSYHMFRIGIIYSTPLIYVYALYLYV